MNSSEHRRTLGVDRRCRRPIAVYRWAQGHGEQQVFGMPRVRDGGEGGIRA